MPAPVKYHVLAIVATERERERDREREREREQVFLPASASSVERERTGLPASQCIIGRGLGAKARRHLTQKKVPRPKVFFIAEVIC